MWPLEWLVFPEANCLLSLGISPFVVSKAPGYQSIRIQKVKYLVHTASLSEGGFCSFLYFLECVIPHTSLTPILGPGCQF